MTTTEDMTVKCQTCGEPLTVAEIREMFKDTDFVPHGDRGHFAGFRPTDRNFRVANQLVRDAS